MRLSHISFFFFFNDTATTEIYTLSLHDALPIWSGQTKLTNDVSADYMSAWSPDDQRIVFVSERDGSPQIFVMNADGSNRSEEHTSELQSQSNLVCRLLLEKKKKNYR